MLLIHIYCLYLISKFVTVQCGDLLGCGGFIKSHVPIDFSKVEIKLLTKQGIVKDKTSCAPNNGYYFIPLYEKGDYWLKLQPPPGWSFNPTEVSLSIDGSTDLCSIGKDINFVFQGFGITGKVESFKSGEGPVGLEVTLKNAKVVRKTATGQGGNFFFTPVYPGQYSVSISHHKWQLLKNSVVVQVDEGNTELPPESLVVAGYDVRGIVKGKGLLNNIKLVLIRNGDSDDLVFIDKCVKNAIGALKDVQQLCHVFLSEDGIFTFPVISPGNYAIIPYCEAGNLHFQPNILTFIVGHQSVILPEPFEVVGYKVSGQVLYSKNGKPIKAAKILLNDNVVAVTKDDGMYTLGNVKPDLYHLKAIVDKLEFKQKLIKIHANVLKLPDLIPSRFEVCGHVLSEKSQTVTIVSTSSNEVSISNSLPLSGKFCQFLAPGKYQMFISISDSERAQGIQFFPITHTLEVISSPIMNVMFSQLKSTISGKLNCIEIAACELLQVILKPANNDEFTGSKVIADLVDNKYTFEDIRPGTYELLLTPNLYCWKEEKLTIVVNKVEETAPTFVQNGYSVNFLSSHSAKATYSLQNQKSESWTVHIAKGKTKYCVEAPGIYIFTVESCHTFEKNIFIFDTDSGENEITLVPVKHQITLAIASRHNLGDLFITVNVNGIKTLEGPLMYKDNEYIFSISLQPNEMAILIPQSETLYVNPPILSIMGQDDCSNLGVQFKAVKGKVFQGKIIPPIEGALITIETDNSESLMTETDTEGKYKFPPQDDSKEFKITAMKDTYLLVGPNSLGDFKAHKLAEVIVEVIDETTGLPLQGALLSLSGGESYRSNLQTGEDGKMIFPSLSPSEYFLRPMMKEYSFEPTSKILKVDEGMTVNVHLRGKRIAYSTFGQTTTLNGEPEDGVIIVAMGLNNCSQYSEESTSDKSGYFRIRGLRPYCNYNIQVKPNLDEKRQMERAAPSLVNIFVPNEDVHGLKFTIFRTTANTDILVHIYAENPDNYKNLRLRLVRETSPSSVVHTIKIDGSNYKITKENNVGILVHVPSVPLDNKMYSIYVECGTSPGRLKGHTHYFSANASFKYIDIEYTAKNYSTEQNIKQTSVWTLIFIFLILLGLYNIDITLQFVKDQLMKLNLLNINNMIVYFRKPAGNESVLDSSEIDEIVQNINAPKRKVKQRKT
ncbi:hypothetical protein FQA39_LY17749 [Lamprigera yunnana]|nr:hypothetical protein FQA39_LY17749 [Lamprigera yunnana]